MSSGFITEAEAAEARKQRQEEWDRVRKPDDPKERPEEPYDHRSLYDRLQEQKQKKELEYQEAHKLKNMIKGLDDDEIEFLDLVDRTKLAADRKKELEDQRELLEFRNRVATLQEKTLGEKHQVETVVNKPKSVTNHKISQQQKLLKGVVVKKSDSSKRKLESDDEEKDSKLAKVEVESSGGLATDGEKSDTPINTEQNVQILVPDTGLKCVAILPGLGCYAESSDECSSDSEIECHKPHKLDLLGRKIEKQEKES